MEHRIFSTAFASVYPHYVAKAERKNRSKEEVDAVIHWLTGYSAEQLAALLHDATDFSAFFSQAPALNQLRHAITGSICGIKIQEIAHPLMKEIRYLDKLVDEIAKGKTLENIVQKLENRSARS